MKRFLILAALVLLAGAQFASAGLKINEVYFSPEDPVEGRQFFEIVNTDGGEVSLDGLWFLEIESDLPIGVIDNPGEVVNAFDLTGCKTGPTDGVFLWRDTAQTLLPAPTDPGFPYEKSGGFNQIFGFDGEFEIGTDEYGEPIVVEYEHDVVTFMLVEGFTGTAADLTTYPKTPGTDIDVNDDGIIDVTPWTSVVDAVTGTEADKLGAAAFYAGQVGGDDIGAGIWFGFDVFHRHCNGEDWILFDSGSGEDEETYYGPFYANDGDGGLTPEDSDAAFYDVATGTATMIPVEGQLDIPLCHPWVGQPLRSRTCNHDHAEHHARSRLGHGRTTSQGIIIRIKIGACTRGRLDRARNPYFSRGLFLRTPR